LLQPLITLISSLVDKQSANKLTLMTLFADKKFIFFLEKLSATGRLLNNILQLSTRSWNFVQNILLKSTVYYKVERSGLWCI